MNWNSNSSSQFPPPHWGNNQQGSQGNWGGSFPSQPGAPGGGYPPGPGYPNQTPGYGPPPGAPTFPGGPPHPSGPSSTFPGGLPPPGAPYLGGGAPPYGNQSASYPGAPPSSYPPPRPPAGGPSYTGGPSTPSGPPPPGGSSYPGAPPPTSAYPGAPSATSQYPPAPGHHPTPTHHNTTFGASPSPHLPHTPHHAATYSSYPTPPTHPGVPPGPGTLPHPGAPVQPGAPPHGPLHSSSPHSAYPSGPAPSHSTSAYPGAPPAHAAFPGQVPLHHTAPDPTHYLGVSVHQISPNLIPTTDYTTSVNALRKALGGFRTDNATVISTLAPLSALEMEAFSRKYTAVTGTSLLATIEKKTSGWFEYALMGMVYGPIEWDARLVHEACSRPGTKESALTEILLNRTNTEIEQLKIAYNKIYGKSLTDMVLDDLSFATKKMFQMALHGHRDAEGPIDRNKILADMDIIDQYARSVGEADNTAICSVLITRSHSHLVELSNEFHKCYARPITEIIRKKFSGHMKEGLEFIAEGIKDEGDGVKRDAGELMKAMKGLGTKDTWLIWRIVRAHWNRARWGHIQQAFASMYNKSLYNWVESETSGAYRDLMLALVRLA